MRGISKSVEFSFNTLKILDKIILAGGGKSVVYLKYIENYFVLFLWYFHSHVSDFVFPFMSIKIFQIEHYDLKKILIFNKKRQSDMLRTSPLTISRNGI